MTTAISDILLRVQKRPYRGNGQFRNNGEYTWPLVRDARINARKIGLCRDLQHCLSTNFYISLSSSKLHLSLQREGDLGLPLFACGTESGTHRR